MQSGNLASKWAFTSKSRVNKSELSASGILPSSALGTPPTLTTTPSIKSQQGGGQQEPKSIVKQDPADSKRLLEICKESLSIEAARQFSNKNAELLCSSINYPIDEMGNLPLHLTVSQNDHIITCLLLLKGANPNVINKSGVAPLMIAERMGYTKIAEVLLLCGARKLGPKTPKRTSQILNTHKIEIVDAHINVNQGLFGSFSKKSGKEQVDEEGRKLVQASMETGVMIIPDSAYLGFQTQLISVIRPETLTDADEAGATALMKAAYAGHLELLKDLLDLGSDPDAMDKTGNTAMVWAVLGGNGRCVQVLYEKGANLNGSVLDSKKVGVTIRGQLSPLIAASYQGNVQIMAYLLKEGCNIDLRCGRGKGKTALMVAACLQRIDAVQLLLKHRAHIEPNFETWLQKGSQVVQNILSNRNAWIRPGGAAVLQRKEKPGDATPQTGYMLDTFGYFTQRNDETDEILALLKNHETEPIGITEGNEKPIEKNSERHIAGAIIQRRPSKKKNQDYRQALNLDKLVGNNPEIVMVLADQVPTTGTGLDELWVAVFQCVVQLVIAANKNIKHQYITISAKVNHCAAEIVRNIEKEIKEVAAQKDDFCHTLVKSKISDLCKIITNEFPKQLMIATRMAIGVWPAPNAVSEMIKEAASLASSSRELVLLANTLGYFPLLDKTFDISFQAYEDAVVVETESPDQTGKDSSLKGGLNYSEYKRQNDLKLIQEMSKNMRGESGILEEPKTDEEAIVDAEFFGTLDGLLKQLVTAAQELKQIHDMHLTEEYVNSTSKVYIRAETIIEEIQNFGLLKDFSDDILIQEVDLLRLSTAGIKLSNNKAPIPLRIVLKECYDELKVTAKNVMAKGKAAASPMPAPNAELEMIQSSIPCLRAVKKLVTIAKDAVVKIRTVSLAERRKRDAWRKECLANEKVKQLFHMWESQVMTDMNPAKASQLTNDEIALLVESEEGIVFDEASSIRRIKGGSILKLIEVLTSHNPTTDDDFSSVFLMTHHSFCTSHFFLEQLIKRYEITPPYGLTQRLFEIFLDKKVVQIRLKVCHVILQWIQNHYEEDFADNALLILKCTDFLSKKVMLDFEQMALQMLDILKKFQERGRTQPAFQQLVASPEKPKPLLASLRFGSDPISNLMNDPRAFLDIDPLEMARQLTLMEHELYTKFQPYECLDQIWEGHLKKENALINQPKPAQPKRHAPGSSMSDISKMIRHTNEFTFFVATCVVNNQATRQRVNMLKYFISVAQHCRELSNLTAVTTIVAGLSMGAISRLHKTWMSFEEKNPKLSETYKELQDLVSPKFQYANYRKALKDMTVPAIPFLGVYLTDLTFLDLGNQDFLPETHYINFEKRRKVFNLIREIQRYQQTAYPLQAVPQIQEFMKKLGEPRPLSGNMNEPGLMMTEDQLYEKSMEVEAKEASSDEDESD